ncbi:MAG: nitroreductase family protein [Bacteroidales bacterium]|nr:nitroreductase family protein [Bacteroidales bacterium]
MKKNRFLIIVIALATAIILYFLIRLDEISTHSLTNSKNIMDTTENQTLNTIFNRKSVRNFTKDEVSHEQLELLLRAGMAAPTARNVQPWAFVAVTERAILDTLATYLPYAKMLFQAPSAIIVCGDLEKLGDMKTDYWIMDCSAATQNILLAAESIGLGAVWTAAYPQSDRVDAVTRTLHLPDNFIPLCVIPIGVPTGVDQPKDKFKADNIHWQQW